MKASESQGGRASIYGASTLGVVGVVATALVVWIIAFGNSGRVDANPQMMDMVIASYLCVSLLAGVGTIVASRIWRSRARAISWSATAIIYSASLIAIVAMLSAVGIVG